MPRFFRRLAEGVFDEEDVKRRADELADFIASASAEYGIAAPVAVGYSNGANIAAAILMRRPQVLAGAVLLRAMTPLHDFVPAPIAGTPCADGQWRHGPHHSAARMPSICGDCWRRRARK